MLIVDIERINLAAHHVNRCSFPPRIEPSRCCKTPRMLGVCLAPLKIFPNRKRSYSAEDARLLQDFPSEQFKMETRSVVAVN